MLWAEDMWAPRSHFLPSSQCWAGTECKLRASLASLPLPGGREKQRGEGQVVPSQHPGKKVCWALGMDAHTAEQHFLRLKKKGSQRVLHNESLGLSQAVSEGEGQADQPCCRQDRRLSYGPGGWPVRQQVWKRSRKEVVVRRGLQFLLHPNCSGADSCTSR